MTKTAAKVVEVMAPVREAPKRVVGRPTAFRPEYCDKIVELMAEGRSLEACARELGVHPDSLFEWQRRHPEFSAAVREGRAASTAFWEERLRAVAMGAAGNAQAIQWALRNRSRAASGWDVGAQKTEPYEADRDAQPTIIDTDDMSNEELEFLHRVLQKVVSSQQ